MSKGSTSLLGSGLYEYAFGAIPLTQRKSTISLFCVLTGFAGGLSCLVLGAKIGGSMDFVSAVRACLIGDSVLVLIGVTLGLLSCKTGCATAFLSSEVLGKRGSAVFSLIGITASVFWIGANANLFTNLLLAAFPRWPLPFSITAALIIICWGLSASRGWSGVTTVSIIVVPTTLLLLLYCVIQVQAYAGGWTFLADPPVLTPMTFSAATAAIIGNYICGATMTPDICRFAASPKAAAISCGVGYGIGFFFFHLCGVIIAKAGGFGELNHAATALGLSLPIFACAFFSSWTTQDNNAYSGSLAMQNIFRGTLLEGNVSHKVATYLICASACIAATLGADRYLIPMISWLSIIVSPIAGMLLSHAIFVRGRKSSAAFNPISFLSWGLGILVGYRSLQMGWLVSPLAAMLCSAAAYGLMMRRPR